MTKTSTKRYCQDGVENPLSVAYTGDMIAMADNIDTLLTLTEAAEVLCCAEQTVRNLIAMNRVETQDTRFGRLITKESVDRYLSEKRGKVGRPKKIG